MSTFAIALKARLLAAPTISARTIQIHWGIVPQGAPLPYVRMQVISDVRPEDLDGYEIARSTRVQVDCFARQWGAARELAEAIIVALDQPATFGGVRFGRIKADGPRDLGEDTEGGFVHRASMDLLVRHRLA